MESSGSLELFLRAVPKPDLHLHLDGSLRLETLLELARENGVELPADDASGLRSLVFKPTYPDLGSYLEGFRWTVAVLRSRAALRRVARELAEDCFAENVHYIEVRFAPQLHAHAELSPLDAVRAVADGLQDTVTSPCGGAPTRAFGIILCALRSVSPSMSPYCASFFAAHEFESNARVASLASSALARLAVRAKDIEKLPVVALDLAGTEAHHPAVEHAEAFSYASHAGLRRTVHAGEAWGAESVGQAVHELSADRIGHGVRLLAAPGGPVSRALLYTLAKARTCFEVCVSSNLQTMPELGGDVARHPSRTWCGLACVCPWALTTGSCPPPH